jgi:hypothetical protein
LALFAIVINANGDDCVNTTEGRQSVKDVFAITKTDKLHRHGYHRHYEEMFSNLRDKKIRLLEIGVLDGKSLLAWKMIFPCAELIAGISYSKAGSRLAPRIDIEGVSVFYGSQADESFLENVLTQLHHKQFDIIIDDGSHIPWHQIFSFAFLFPKGLVRRGLYIVEDIETSYWSAEKAALYGYPIEKAGVGRPSPGNALELFKQFIDVMNRGYLDSTELTMMYDIDHEIQSITFVPNMVILTKKSVRNDPYVRQLTDHNMIDMAQVKSWIEDRRKEVIADNNLPSYLKGERVKLG